ncbi:Uncharacterised protein [Mycobacteroides abscessus subsp. abscessus]|uniref:hypothetical protein n=1 Tax=Mycobacteroides abscessus TaxID=36809 RepID=UPI000925EA7A|nr:hypothetical protein [Mycobacteroides abscessus]SHU85782.1 Uncharacterised protein [Mycobacteroides abscessus subsp. abscessus]
MAEHYLSTSEVAAALGINLNTLNSRMRAGEFIAPDAVLGGRYQGWLPATVAEYRDRGQSQPLPDLQAALDILARIRAVAEAVRILEAQSADGRVIASDLYALSGRLESHIRDLLLGRSEEFHVHSIGPITINTIEVEHRAEQLHTQAHVLTELAGQIRELLPPSQAAMYVEKITVLAQHVRSRRDVQATTQGLASID